MLACQALHRSATRYTYITIEEDTRCDEHSKCSLTEPYCLDLDASQTLNDAGVQRFSGFPTPPVDERAGCNARSRELARNSALILYENDSLNSMHLVKYLGLERCCSTTSMNINRHNLPLQALFSSRPAAEFVFQERGTTI
jgi:hypothetical protein